VNTDGIKHKMISSSFWSSVENAALQALSFLVFLILARLLQPDDYGLMAIVMVFVTVLGAISGFGISAAMVQIQELEGIHLNSGFWFSLTMGLLLYLIIYVGAPYLALLYEAPDLQSVLLYLGLIVVIDAAGTVPRGLLSRHFRFRFFAFRSITSTLFAGVIGITMATNGYGVWALVAQQLSAATVRTLLTWSGAGWVPKLEISWPALRSLLSVGGYMMGNSLSNTLSRQADNLLVGTFLGTRALGVYSIGFKVFESVNGVLLNSFSRLGVPTFSRLQDTPDRLANAYRQVWTMGAALTLPVFVLIILTAPGLVPAIFGSQWAGSAIVLQFLMIASCCKALTNFDAPLLFTCGRARLAFRLTLLRTALNIAGFAIVVNWGINAVAAVFAVAALVMVPVWKFAIEKYSPASLAGSSQRLVSIGIGLSALSGVVPVVALILADASTLVLIAAQWLTGLFVYSLAVLLLDRTMRPGVQDLIKQVAGIR